MKTKVFIDAGANLGQSIRAFIKNFSDAKDYKIFSFEPATTKRIKSKLKEKIKQNNKEGYQIKYIPKAVWTHDGTVKFYEQDNEGSTTEAAKKNIVARKHKVREVDCVDLAKFIDQFPDDSHIILKMDIEGGEYRVMKHLHETGTLKKVNELYIELHACKISDKTIQHDYDLLDMLAEHKLAPVRWDGNKPAQVSSTRIYTRDLIRHDWKRYGRLKEAKNQSGKKE